MKRILVLISFLSISLFNYGQTELYPDRPGQAYSVNVIPVKAFNIETGFSAENDNSDLSEIRSFTYNSTLLRYGIYKDLEVRASFGLTNTEFTTINNFIPNQTTNLGFLPLYIGGKYHIPIDIENTSFAILAGYQNLLDRKNNFENIGNNFDLVIAANHTINSKLSLGFNIAGIHHFDTDNNTYIYAIALGIGITEKLSAFIEPYGFAAKNRDMDLRFDAGLAYLIFDYLQVDISGGFGVTDISPDNFISFGLAIRLPN